MADEQQAVEKPAEEQPRRSKKRIIWSVLAAIAILAVIAGTYYWQHSKVVGLQRNLKSTNDKLATADKKSSTLSKSLDDANKKYVDLDSQYKVLQNSQKAVKDTAPPSQEDLALTVGEATTYRSGSSVIGIIITLKNTTNSSISISPNVYKLKDSSNRSFTYESAPFGLGPNYAGLTSQTLEPGETVTGALGFTIADDSVTNYSLIIGTHSYPVNAHQL